MLQLLSMLRQITHLPALRLDLYTCLVECPSESLARMKALWLFASGQTSTNRNQVLDSVIQRRVQLYRSMITM